MKRENKLMIGICLWFVLGLFSIVLGWEHFVTWVISTYIYYVFVEPYSVKDKSSREKK